MGAGSDRPERARADDRSLVRRMLAGDERAFEEFAEAYVPPLHRFAASRLRDDRDLTRDIVQTTLVKAIAGLSSFRGQAALFTWLCACCKTEIAAHVRQRKQAREPIGLPDAAAPASGPEESALSGERARLVHSALDLLPPRYSRALEWKYLDNLPVQEIAERLSLKLKAAESLLTRAREAFRETYARLEAGPGSRPQGRRRPGPGWEAS